MNHCEALDGRNALMCHITSGKFVNIETSMLLLAAGERLDINWVANGPTVLDHLNEVESDRILKNICRQAIRNCLLDLDPNSSLFNRVAWLPLPTSLKEFLVYNIAIN